MFEEVAENAQDLSLVCTNEILFCDPGDDVVLSCQLNRAISAASMEIMWWNKEDLICHYKDGRVTVSSDVGVTFSWQDLHNGNVSLTLRDVRRSQMGHYICEVINERRAMKVYIFLHISSEDISLVIPNGIVSADPGSDVILPVHLSPETSAVSMTVRWFRETELIYQYKNGQEETNNQNQVRLSIHELERGNLSLTLRNVQQSGKYTCKVFHDGCQETGVIHLQVREPQKRKHISEYENLPDFQRQTQTETTFQETLDPGDKNAKKMKYNSEERRMQNLINNLESEDFLHFGLTPGCGNGNYLLITEEFLLERLIYNEHLVGNCSTPEVFIYSESDDSAPGTPKSSDSCISESDDSTSGTPKSSDSSISESDDSAPGTPKSSDSSISESDDSTSGTPKSSDSSISVGNGSTPGTPKSSDSIISGASCGSSESFDTALRGLESLLSDEPENAGATRTQEQTPPK